MADKRKLTLLARSGESRPLSREELVQMGFDLGTSVVTGTLTVTWASWDLSSHISPLVELAQTVFWPIHHLLLAGVANKILGFTRLSLLSRALFWSCDSNKPFNEKEPESCQQSILYRFVHHFLFPCFFSQKRDWTPGRPTYCVQSLIPIFYSSFVYDINFYISWLSIASFATEVLWVFLYDDVSLGSTRIRSGHLGMPARLSLEPERADAWWAPYLNHFRIMPRILCPTQIVNDFHVRYSSTVSRKVALSRRMNKIWKFF
jgi:hypothetical protein